MVRNNYNYRLTLYTSAGEAAGVFAIRQPDWEPACEAAWLQALRTGQLTGAEPFFDVRIEPVWHESLGAPWVAGIRAVPELNGGAHALALEFPFTLFKSHAAQAAAMLIEREVLRPLELYRYLVTAQTREKPHVSGPVLQAAGPRRAPVNLQATSLAEAVCRSAAVGERDDSDFRVLIPERVLEEVSEQTTRAGEAETGSILLGHLRRDTETADVFLEITAQVPAPHTSANQTRLTFTAASWTAVRAAVALRGQGELMAGWAHSHPQKFWRLKCSERCPPEKRVTCPLAGAAFFSDDDITLHRAIFPTSFCVALLVTVTEGGLRYALFGWRQGTIQQRGFDLVAARNPARFLPVAAGRAIVGDDCHE